jgi:hypothetical protein
MTKVGLALVIVGLIGDVPGMRGRKPNFRLVVLGLDKHEEPH